MRGINSRVSVNKPFSTLPESVADGHPLEKQLQGPAAREEHHHNVYVVLLAPAAGRLAAVRAANPTRLESLSVGMRTIHSVRSPAA